MSTDKVHTTGAETPNADRLAVGWPDLRRRLRKQEVLADVVEGTQLSPSTVTMTHLTADSRAVEPDGAFVAIRGTTADGHAFIGDAVKAGARILVCETVPDEARERFPETLFARVTDTRVALAEMAAALYDDPADALRMVGVTGTNGKTTVAFLVHHLLEALGETPGLISTIEVRTGTDTATADLTTPGPVALQRTLRGMVEQGCTACAMEVSSHALDQKRVHGVDYDVAAFTNLTVDHLDYHGTPEAYRQAKKRLFDGLDAAATALYNADDENGTTMVADTTATTTSFALDRTADIQPVLQENTVDGLTLTLDGYTRTFRLAGRFNAYNLATAYGVGRAAGYAPEAVVDALAEAPPVPGRFEQVDVDEDGPSVVVDYAHTPDALSSILQAVRDTMPATAALWCVFGCGGDRDVSKREAMGQIAEEQADRIIVTSDNPRTEDPAAILDDIREGMMHPAEAWWVVDREEAIRTAAEHAAPDDVVLIAGKGHETHQVIGTEKRPFDDREIARKHFG